MNKTEQTVLKILEASLNNGTYKATGEEDWPAIYQELKHQSLLPMTYTWAKRQDKDTIDPEIKNKWTQALAAQSVRWYAMMGEQKKLVELLSKHGYPIAIMKGNANGIYYPTPQVRGSGDVDFLVKWDSYDELYQLLTANGYTLSGEKKESKHHVALCKNKVIFEMHKRPGGTHLDGTNEQKELIRFFQDGLDSIEYVPSCNYTIPVLPKSQNGMVLLMHTAGHMKEGLGLRHLLDWMMYIKKEGTDEFWTSELEPMAKKAHLDTFAKVLTKTCQKYLGLTQSITWCKDIQDDLCDQLMEYFLYQGDFGSKNQENDKETKVMTDSNSLAGFLKRLDTSSQYSFPLSGKYKILKPAAWIYQLYRYVRKGLGKEHPIKAYRESKKAGRERRELFEKLGM